jgi:HK97 family phage prohead protease
MDSKVKHIEGELRAIPDDVEKTRTISFIISSEKKDAHGTVLSMDGWDLRRYKKNGIVGYQHDVYGDDMFKSPNPDSVIGTGKVYIEDKYLIGDVTFEPAEINPLAEKIFRKVLFGTLKATSVGFVPIEKGKYVSNDEDGGTYYYGKRELLEFSIVNIPSNPDAVRREFEDIENEINELKGIKDTQSPTSVPEDEKLRLRFELTKIL